MQDSPDLGDRGDAVCVVGAGASGLTAIKNLRELGFAVDCYERETSVGGAWNWRHDRSPVYAGAHVISSRPLTEFPDFPMPDTWPDYPHHSRILEYLERYAKHFGLGEHIWYGMEVAGIVPVDDGRWDVTIRSTGGGTSRVQRYAAVVIANGHNWSPVTPEIPGEFAGQVIHANAYKDPSRLRGRKVLVVGGGNTGCDIAVEAAQHATRVWHSTRRGYWHSPKYIGDRPADQVHHRRLPSMLRQWRYRRTAADLTRWGVPAPEQAPNESNPVVNGLLPHYLAHGRIEAVPDVARYDGAAVELADGRRIEPELVITATGYRPRFDFLAPELLDCDEHGRPDLHLHAFARRHPTLAVVGLVQPSAGVFPLAHWQSVAVARWLRLRITDPERAAAVQQKESTRPLTSWSRRKAVPTRRYWFEVDHVDYLRALESLLNEMAAA
ncbi:NAD(P)-binding domain-containing protein [Actinoplanes sp. NEAU-A12]|uniref:NAD(P)-binding domain-containing protein n=1 Tax=Actinoplanes sandaracinus TaxID=3045177 RepID=A0ABT6WE60_9ACTN|nr:NAD(P)-binding domain-containing protein [Actinoplanes sandaracinus]MDI6097983.1 NAD(P)-binding domain-containing protein [Actinoplanes sandaracinus]